MIAHQQFSSSTECCNSIAQIHTENLCRRRGDVFRQKIVVDVCLNKRMISLTKRWLTEFPKRFRRKLKASKCVKSLRKRIKNSAEPSIVEPFFNFRRAKTDSVGKIQSSNGFGLNPKGFVFFRQNFFCCAELKKEFCEIVYPFFRL